MVRSNFLKSLPIVAAELGQKFGVRVVVGGTAAATDGSSIRLPDPGSDFKELELLGYLAHEAGHVRFSSFRELERMKSRLDRELTNAIEDVRIEKKMGRIYGGARELIDIATEPEVKKIIDALDEGTIPNPGMLVGLYLLSAGEVEVNKSMIYAATRDAAGERLAALFGADFVGELDRKIVSRIDGLESTEDAHALAGDVLEMLKALTKGMPESPNGRESSGNGGSGEGKSGKSSSTQGSNSEGAAVMMPLEIQPADSNEASSNGTCQEGDASEGSGSTQRAGSSKAPSSGKDGAEGDSADAEGSGDSSGSSGENEGAEGNSAGNAGEDSDASDSSSSSSCGSSSSSSGSDASSSEGSPSSSASNAQGLDGSDASTSGGTGSGSGGEKQGKEGSPKGRQTAGKGTKAAKAAKAAAKAAKAAQKALDLSSADGSFNISEAIRMKLEKAAMEHEARDGSNMIRNPIEFFKPGDVFTERWKNCELVFGKNSPKPSQIERGRSRLECAQDLAGSLQRALMGFVQAESRRRAWTAERGQRISSANLTRAACGSARIFEKRVETKAVDTAVHVLLDLSGSMLGREEVSIASALGIVMALTRIPHVSPALSVLQNNAFRSVIPHGTRRIENYEGFVGKLSAYGGTPLATAIGKSAFALSRTRANRHVLMVLTDGQPNEYEAASARLLIRELEESDVDVVGIGIELYSNDRKEMATYFKNFVDVKDVKDLPEKLFECARTFLGQGIARNRSAA